MFGLIELGEYRKWQGRRANAVLSPDVTRGLRALVVGGGSVGQRHLSNLLGLGVTAAVVEPREDRRREIESHYGALMTFDTEACAYASGPYDVVVVANPPAFHLASAGAAVRAGAHVLVEKSLSHTLDGVESFLRAADEAERLVGVCYVYRFFDTLQYVKTVLDEGLLGRPFSAQITFSEYLPDWHPWEDPSEWYVGHKSQGGSELLDENHTVDFARWFFGEITSVSGIVARVADLTVDSDDFAELTCVHEGGTVSQIHQDAFGRKPRKDMRIMGERGNLYWDSYMGANAVEHYDAKTGVTRVVPGRVSRADAFFELLRDFLECVVGGGEPAITGWDAYQTLKICKAAEESCDDGRRARRV